MASLLAPWRALLGAALLSIAAAGCGDDGPLQAGSIEAARLDMADFGYSGPTRLAAGPLRLTAQNRGDEIHQAVFVRLNPGVTVDQFVAAAGDGFGDALALGTFVGGAELVPPDVTQTVTIELEPGDYAVFCIIASPADGVSHLAKGMVAEVTVAGPASDGAPGTLLPPVDGEIELIDWAFGPPDSITAGDTYRVVNRGDQVHQLGISALGDDNTADDVLAYLRGEVPDGTPPPMRDRSGTGWLSPGQSQNLPLDLPPGRYVFVCYLVDPADHDTPHFLKGMIREVTIEP